MYRFTGGPTQPTSRKRSRDDGDWRSSLDGITLEHALWSAQYTPLINSWLFSNWLPDAQRDAEIACSPIMDDLEELGIRAFPREDQSQNCIGTKFRLRRRISKRKTLIRECGNCVQQDLESQVPSKHKCKKTRSVGREMRIGVGKGIWGYPC